MRTNLVYELKKDISKRSRELYNADVFAFPGVEGKKRAITFGLSFPSPLAIGDDYFKDVCDFFKTLLMMPNFKDGKLKKDVIDEIKNDLLNNVKNNLSNPNVLQEYLFNEHVFKDSDFNNHTFTSVEEFNDLLESVKDSDIIELYNKTLNNFICGYVFGNLSIEDIEYLDNSFNFNPIDFDYDYSKKELVDENNVEISNGMLFFFEN